MKTIFYFILITAINGNSSFEINELGKQGVELFVAGNYENALNKFERIIQLNDRHVEAYVWKADCLGKLDRKQESIKFYTTAIQLDPKSKLAFYNRAVTYQDIHEYYNAENDYLQALDLDPTNSIDMGNDLIYNNLGIVYSIQDNLDKAILAYFNAVRINKEYHEAHYNLGHARELKGAYKSALESYRSAVNIKPENVEYLAAMLRMMGLVSIR